MARVLSAKLGFALVFLLLAGCGRPDDPSRSAPSSEADKAPLKKPAEPLLLTKDGKPFIMFDVTPLMRGVKKVDATAVLLRAALATVVEKALSSPKYEKMDSFTLRMVHLNSYDECGRPKWGDAFDLALLKTSRARLRNLDTTELSEMSEASLAGCFDEIDLKTENVNQALGSSK